jgi:hypothetical protein
MVDLARRRAMEETGDLLSKLLTTKPAYRQRWLREGQRIRSGERPSEAAVSRVIANYLWDIGERKDTETGLPRTIRYTVRRALTGSLIIGQTLTWFIGAFDIEDQDSTQLWKALSGDNDLELAHITDTVPTPRPMGKRQWHRTMALFERFAIGADRSYISRRTNQTIQAIENGVDSYLFNHEPYAKRINVIYGGALGKHYEYGDGLVSDDIDFGFKLNVGQRTALEYETLFDEGVHFPTEVRRAVRARVENLDFAIQFSLDQLPKAVWFCAWPDHYLHDPVFKQPLELKAGRVNRFFAYAQQTVLGFQWEW